MASSDPLPFTSAAEPTPASPELGNPFLSSVCRTPWDVDGSVDGLNAEVLDQLVDAVEARAGGPLVLLTAPRAGYGKTHLLGRVAAATSQQAVMVPLAFRAGDALTLTTLARRGIESLSQAEGERPGWSRLRESSAQVIALLLHKLIESGQLTCANPAQALAVLSGSVEEVFDAQGRARLIGEWIGKNRDSLRGPLAMLAAKSLPLRAELLDGWLGAMLDQSREGGLTGVAEMQELAAADAESGLPAWLRLLSIWRPVVLLVDHLDGLYRNPQAGVAIATLLMDLVDCHQVHVLLSLNQDVWQATFGHHLPSALEDRLTTSQVLLRGLSEADAEALLRLRLGKSGLDEKQQAEFEAFVSVQRHFLGRPIGSVSARAFLRHCARQWEIFQTAPPSSEAATDRALPAIATFASPAPISEEEPVIPLMTETVDEEPSLAPAPVLPDLFDTETASEMQFMAESLAEPRPALPQDEPLQAAETVRAEPTPVVLPNKVTAPTPADPVSDDEDSADDWHSTPGVAANGTGPSADAFVKLREMLARLRQPGGPAALATASGLSASIQSPFRAQGDSAALPARQAAAIAPVAVTKTVPDALQGRFQALRLQMSAEAQVQPLDYAKIADLIRLAGRRFPLVRFSEHELPGLTGRYAMYWALQGVEILFGLAPFTDFAYWRTLSGFAAGRLADLATQAERESRPPPTLKLVSFKTEREQLAWQNLTHSQTLPAPLREITDIVHLDMNSLASLYAMQRIIKEAESGTLQAEPTQVMTVLARELDFFWKRVTRVG